MIIYFTTTAPHEATAFSPSPSINFQKKFVAHIARARSPRRPWRRPAAFRLPARPRGRPAAAPGAAQARVAKLLRKLSAPWNLLRKVATFLLRPVAFSQHVSKCFQMFRNVSKCFQMFPHVSKRFQFFQVVGSGWGMVRNCWGMARKCERENWQAP